MDFQDLSDTKSLSTFSIKLNPSFTLHLSQQNNTQNHGTTVWDSAKLLAFYLFDTIKKPTFSQSKVQNSKTCLELGSGCGLGGLVMASLGFETVLTDLPEVVDRVLQPNCDTAIDAITDWWYHLQHTADLVDPPRISVAVRWIGFPTDGSAASSTLRSRNHYIIASDCIYEIELVEAPGELYPLLCLSLPHDFHCHGETGMMPWWMASLARPKQFGFEARNDPQKAAQQQIGRNEDVEIWKLKLRKKQNHVML
ncbi:hypothetical protein FB192DRAFT_1407449, partial [Mucor lusitanicus]